MAVFVPINTIWCIFSIDNNYDQPSNNLLWWDHKKPSIDHLAQAIYSKPLAQLDDKYILQIVSIWRGERARIDDTEYRLEEKEPGHTR